MKKSTVIGVVAVAVMMISLSAAIILMNQNETEGDVKVQLVARVNTDGSGMFAKDGLNLATTTSGVVEFNDPEWDMIVIVTPGPGTIQHVTIAQIVKDMGYNFLQYSLNTVKSSGNVYWLQMSSAGVVTDFVSNSAIDAGIIWEPIFSQAIQQTTRNAETVFRTNDYDPGHTCCCIAVNSGFLKNNSETTVAFLAGYIKSVEFVEGAMANKIPIPAGISSLSLQDAINKLNNDPEWNEYVFLVYLSMKKTQMSQEVVVSALEHVTYAYADSDGTLDSLRTQIGSLTQSFYDGGAVSLKPISNTGSESISEFADRFVSGTYIEEAKNYTGTKNATVGVQVISGDIHQIALHIGDVLGFFGDYGISIEVDGALNGPGVITALLSGEKDIGFLGAPPAIINVINMGK